MKHLACLLPTIWILQLGFAADLQSPTPQRPWQSGTHTLTIDNRERTFILDVPKHLPPNAPLVFVFHGFTGSAKDIHEFSAFTPLTEKHSFVAVYPQGTRDAKDNTFFNVGYAFHDKETVDDVSFARQLAARLVHDLNLNPQAIFSTGMSNGADMSYYLARQPQPFVRAIAPVAGTMMSSWSFPAHTSRISVMEVHGTQDDITRWAGDPQDKDGWGAYLSTDDVMNFWINCLGLEKSTITELQQNPTTKAEPIRLHRWWTPKDKCEVLLYEIPHGGHDWPKHLDNPNQSTATIIWNFFQSHL